MSPELVFLHAGHTARCNARVDKHFDGYYTLQFCYRGSVELMYDGRAELLTAPVFWTCWPGPRIQFHVGQGRTWDHRYVAVRGPGMVRLIEERLFFFGITACPPAQTKVFAHRMDELITLTGATGRLRAMKAANRLEALLIELAEWRRKQNAPEPWLEKLLQALRQDPAAAPDYAALARSSGMGLSTLRRKFREQTGMALHHYTLELRMAEARRLVVTSNLPLKEIADQLGYDNLFYFSRQFKKFHTLPPADYRRTRQA